VDGRLPPWRIVGGEFYAMSSLRAPLRRGNIVLAAEEIIAVAERFVP
jgi:hypothetical protein